jgi:transcriptional regulator with XRE-family HTH domain
MRRVMLELRRLRMESGLPGVVVAHKLGISPSTISRMENYGHGLDRDSLIELLTLYQAPRGLRTGLLRLHEKAGELGLLDHGDLLLDEGTGEWIGLEQDAVAILNYETMLVPSLLQTFPYARALCEGSDPRLSEQEVNERTNARIARQVLLRRRGPLEFKVVLHESALREWVGGSLVMRGQLVHLLETARRPGVELRVLPFGRGAHPGLTSSFTIMDYCDLPSLVLLQNKVSDLYLEAKADVNAYKLTWQVIMSLAYPPEASVALIKRIARTLRQAEKGRAGRDDPEEHFR